jgi:hypothetical protein
MQRFVLRFLAAICLVCVVGTAAGAAEEETEDTYRFIADRRKDQFQQSSGYALFPFPYSLPGIGTGISLVGALMNFAGTHADVYGMLFTGEVRGASLGVADIHIIPETLIFDTGFSSVSAVTIQNYSKRGMNTDKHDYRLIELGDLQYYGGRMTATFLDRRVEFFGAMYEGGGKLESVRDKDGNVIIEAQNASRERNRTILLGTRFDLTDDYGDPRRGVRLEITRSLSPPRDSGPDFYVMDYSTTGYIPLGRRSTWAFNYLRSDAVVERQGETDRATLENTMDLQCSTLTDPEEQQFCNEVIDNTIANNTYGTASSLGGFSRLRGYSQSRYQGAHTVFYGTEIRWNLTDERTPFDIFIMKDVRTSVQVAAFYEAGSTADARSEVGDIMRDSYGFGMRVVTASGVVFRGDIGFGKEGVSPAIFIGYPWEL